MRAKFSEDVIPLSDLKVNPGRVVKHATEAHRPVLLTSRGRGVAVMQSVAEFEKAEEERAFMRAVLAGLGDLEAGRELSRDEVADRREATRVRIVRVWRSERLRVLSD